MMFSFVLYMLFENLILSGQAEFLRGMAAEGKVNFEF